jgi:hypothetical protein
MPPPQAPPLTSAIDFINYNTYYQAAISAVAAASSSSHQSYLNYNQFLINNNNTNNSNSALVRPNHNLTNIQASGYLDTHRTGETDTIDKTANNFYSNKASFFNARKSKQKRQHNIGQKVILLLPNASFVDNKPQRFKQ